MRVPLAVAAVLTGVAGVLMVGKLRWNSETERLLTRLRSSGANELPFSSAELAELPDPVVRYFNFALASGQSLVRAARLQQTGEMAFRPGAWNAFTATEYLRVNPPGFVWAAKIRVAPLISVHVRDGYWAGEGAMTGKLAALIPVVDERGSAQMAAAELLRYLAEAVLLPTALLPRQGVGWIPIDGTTARATITDQSTIGRLRLHLWHPESDRSHRRNAASGRRGNGRVDALDRALSRLPPHRRHDDPHVGRRGMGRRRSIAPVLARTNRRCSLRPRKRFLQAGAKREK